MGYFEPGFSWNDEYDLWYLSFDDSVLNNKMICDVPCEDNIILMQSTGLHDKNGLEIFEGDIVIYNKVAWGKDDWSIPVPVVWNKNYARFDFPDSFNGMIYNKYEIIGNIYENGELLNAKS